MRFAETPRSVTSGWSEEEESRHRELELQWT